MSSRKVMAIQARKKRKPKPKKVQNRKKSDSLKPKKSESDKNDDLQTTPPKADVSQVDENDTDSAPDIDEEEILGSDDDEQESPKDYCKVILKFFKYEKKYFFKKRPVHLI